MARDRILFGLLLTCSAVLSCEVQQATAEATGAAETSDQYAPADTGVQSHEGAQGSDAGVGPTGVRSEDVEKAYFARQWVVLGLNNELITPTKKMSLPNSALAVVPTGEAIVLAVRPDLRSVLIKAVVNKNGDIVWQEPVAKSSGEDARPKIWPWRDSAGIPRLPDQGVILSATSGQKARIARPQEATQWVFPTASGDLYVPARDAEPPENVLWVIPKPQGGFELRHSGPLQTVIFATILPDRMVQWGPGAEGLPFHRCSDDRWICVDAGTERPILGPTEDVTNPFVHADPYTEVFVNGDGSMFMETRM
jgi:hypothetical protein